MQPFSCLATLEHYAVHQPDADAIVCGGITVSYGDLYDRVTSFAVWLLQQGFLPGEVSGVSIKDKVSHLVCAMALLAVHTPQVNLPSHETAANKRALARKLSVRQVIAEQSEEWMEGTALIALIPSLGGVPLPTSNLLGSDWRQGRPLDAIGIYQNTSGSTSVPKTFGLTLERLTIISQRLAGDPYERRVLRTGSIEFDSSRLHHICGFLAGNTSVLTGQVQLRDLAPLCERAKVTEIQIGTYKLASLMHGEAGLARRLPAFTRVVSGASRVPGPLRRKIRAILTDNLWVSYATSELGPISLAAPDEHEAFPEGIGKPLQGVTVELLDPDGRLVEPGQIGEARVRKRGSPSEYLSEPAASSAFRDGWFYPRDLLSRTERDTLIFHGRVDDVMILNGINIFPSAIEDTLEGHPDVREAAAFAVKSRIHGEIPVAAVVLAEGAPSRNTSYLVEHCRQSLGVRAPREIIVVERIPRNHAGKPLRRELALS